MIFLRVFFRTKSNIPVHKANIIEKIGGRLNYYVLYGLMVFMLVTGFGMGYLSGYGVPFFSTHVPGSSKEKAKTKFYKDFTGWCNVNHIKLGKVLEYLIPLHIGASAYHFFYRGTNPFPLK